MVDANERVLLVDGDDRPLGSLGKLEAHRRGLRHRAFSIFLADRAGNVLLQSRSADKYHSGGLWSNACCGHPRPGESNLVAARRRLREEMGLDAELKPAGKLSYRATLSDGWYENEVVHLFVGRSDTQPSPNPAEVADWRRVAPARLTAECANHPNAFTAWLSIYLNRIPATALVLA